MIIITIMIIIEERTQIKMKFVSINTLSSISPMLSPVVEPAGPTEPPVPTSRFS